MTRHFTQDKALHRKQSITRKALHSRQGISRKTRQYTQDKSLHKRQGISRKKREFLQDMGLHEMQVIKRKTKLFCAAGVVGERDGPHLHHHDPRQHPRSATSACYCGRGGGLKNLNRRKTTFLADIFCPMVISYLHCRHRCPPSSARQQSFFMFSPYKSSGWIDRI